MYISWTDTNIAPMRQLAGAKRVPLISPSKSADVSYKATVLYDIVVIIVATMRS